MARRRLKKPRKRPNSLKTLLLVACLPCMFAQTPSIADHGVVNAASWSEFPE